MRILVTGANGQLGRSISDRASNYPDYQMTYTDLEELDIADYYSVEKVVQDNQIQMIINCASYNAVDKAEDEPMTALLINGKAVQGLAGIAKKHNIGLVHVSTDYIFDGKKSNGYTEVDEPHPQSKYAHSKYIGEQAVNTANPRAAIIRTSWLYSEYAHNFVKTIVKLAKEKDELRVVNDQIGSPTYAGDLADAILQMIPSIANFDGVQTYHYANGGKTSWAEFAKKIIEIADLTCVVTPVTTEEYGISKASRPAYSLLDTSKIRKEYKFTIPAWEDSLKKCLENLLKE